MINIAWPRTPDAPWYDNWLVALSAVVGVGIGAIYMVLAKPYLSAAMLGGRHPDRPTPEPSLGEVTMQGDNDEVQLRDAPDYPLSESLATIKKADELGYYAVYAADETWHKDLWLLFAAAAADTTQIRMGPSVSGVVLREPTLIAQAAATLDELTDGRAEVVLSSGNFGLLAQYGIDWAKTKPLSRVKEGVAGDPHPARRRRDHPRRRVLQLQRAVHLRPAGAGAPAGEDGRDARARSRSRWPPSSPTAATTR